jgi:hypothetical protein
LVKAPDVLQAESSMAVTRHMAIEVIRFFMVVCFKLFC